MIALNKFQLLPAGRLSAVIAIIYFLTAYIFLQLAFNATNASPVWPPSGIAFVAVWFLGYRIIPGIWLGAFTANLIVFMQHGWPLPSAVIVSMLIGIGNSIEALFGVFLLRSFTDQVFLLSKIRDIFKFVFAVLIACLSSATIGTSAVYFTNHALGVNFDMIWFTWWLGDVVGMLVISSVFLTFHLELCRLKTWRNAMEAVLVCLVLIIVNTGVFMGKFPAYGFYSHVTYLVLPFGIWSTYRFGFPGATVSILITSCIAVIGSILHLGPFVSQHEQESLVIIQCFIGVISVTVLTLAAALYERKKAEENIKYNEALFRSLVENSFEVVAMIDSQAKVIYSSPPTKYILGYENADLLGHSMFEWIHPDDIPVVNEIFKNLVKNPGAIAHATCRMRRKDGIWRWMEGSGRNLLEDPAISAIIVNYRDITERMLSQERFVGAVEFSPVANIMVNKEGEIQLVNKTTETLFGYSRQELLKMKIESLVPHQFRGKHPGFRDHFHHNPQARPMGAERELFVLKKDGQQVPVEIGLTPIETEQGLCILASIVDITQRKKAEEILQRDKESLEKLVDERSKELIKTQKELKHYSRLADIGTLAATVAHELRNPLGVIQLAAYNLKREKFNLDNDKHLINIEKKVWEGNQIIDNLLSYSRIKIPSFEKVQVIQILDECAANAQARFGDKNIRFEKSYSVDMDLIEADPNQIREIFINILNNACQAIVKSDGQIKLSVEINQGQIDICIQDNGVGIAQEDLAKVFEPFFTRKSKGTGLGMAICNELVNLHQGKIEIKSKLGEGTTVCVLLPVQRGGIIEDSSH